MNQQWLLRWALKLVHTHYAPRALVYRIREISQSLPCRDEPTVSPVGRTEFSLGPTTFHCQTSGQAF